MICEESRFVLWCGMAEEWRDVAGFEGKYQISNHGRLKRLEHTRKAGPIKAARLCERISLGFLTDHGYRRATMGRGRKEYIHRLVCEAFHGPCPDDKYLVAHYDGNRQNNHADNLRWATDKENRKDGARLGEIAKGADLPQTILTPEQVKEIRRLYGEGLTQSQIAPRFGIGAQHCGQIARRRIWKHID